LAHTFCPFHLQKRGGYKKVYWKISPLTVAQVKWALRLLFLQQNGEVACGSAGLKKGERTSEAIAVSAENTITATVMILVVSKMLEKA